MGNNNSSDNKDKIENLVSDFFDNPLTYFLKYFLANEVIEHGVTFMKKKTERMLVAGRIASHLSNKSNWVRTKKRCSTALICNTFFFHGI